MPELPEVETVVRLLRPRLIGRRVLAVDVAWRRTLGGMGEDEFARAVVGCTFVGLWRRAKYLVFELERGGTPAGYLVGHLRMSGRMHVEARDWDAGVHRRVSLSLEGDRVFHFIDVRKFGRLCFERDLQRVFAKLGDEPLAPGFDAARLRDLLAARRRMLKPALLDQSLVAGLGNIYVDEALHRARLHPRLDCSRLDGPATRRLCLAIRATLAAAIEREGSSFDTFYRTPEGQPGSYQARFRVYGREGRACKRCGTPIVKFTLAQRGTHVCPTCQPRRGSKVTAAASAVSRAGSPSAGRARRAGARGARALRGSTRPGNSTRSGPTRSLPGPRTSR